MPLSTKGLEEDLDKKKILKCLMKNLHCNGSIKDAEKGQIMTLTGDFRSHVHKFLVSEEICTDDEIVIHGG